ncbi:DUF4383 domain-containing protein [Kineococcus radiotolerans]|uniref:DUF4383 domain-containing protein n=1 Tax=Kineococcus radiotolerans (strain ATCC BAA-149 / DSM 14245 / SRS30216) TaxID=266940 RepID=A6WFL3_KINRD|nr:DUF4383 domain-containing protein [Kineococcus radiotolerans]ABS05602.1 hypothetical protein Krad_4139 [Kineococcus radiotolerans SRS30216 = ATCC BAA-149]
MSTTRSKRSTDSGLSVHRSPVALTSLVVGAAFILVGVMGFIPGITTNYGDMAGAGHHSSAMLLGIFQVSVLHNLLHLALGVLGVLASRATAAARMFLLVGGVAYLGLWIYGMVVPETSSANFVPLNTADDWLHLVLGLGMVLLGLVMPRRQSNATAATYAGPTAGGDIQ